MRLGNCSVLIPEGREHGTGHVGLVHNQVYTLRLMNHGHVRCDADVAVDGKTIGCFRLDAHREWTLERPAEDTGRFTFYRADSAEGGAVGAAEISRQERGVVSVTFRPERAYRPSQSAMQPRPLTGQWPTTRHRDILRSCGDVEQHTSGSIGMASLGGTSPTACSTQTSAGVTGLTGTSGQQFVNVANLDYDSSAEVTIVLRLVCEGGPVAGGGPRRLEPAHGVRTATPAPVE